jgi:hypothetical protein
MTTCSRIPLEPRTAPAAEPNSLPAKLGDAAHDRTRPESISTSLIEKSSAAEASKSAIGASIKLASRSSGHKRSKSHVSDGSDADAETGSSEPELELDELETPPPAPSPSASYKKLTIRITPSLKRLESSKDLSQRGGLTPTDVAEIQRALDDDSEEDNGQDESEEDEADTNLSPSRPSLVDTKSYSLPDIYLAQRGNVYHQHATRATNTGVTALPGRVPVAQRRPPAAPPAPTTGTPAAAPAVVMSPSPSQTSLPPHSQASQTSITSQPTRSRYAVMTSSPVTRSHCKYHKISLELYDHGPRVMFVVPGCSLVNRKHMLAEDIIDHGDATVDDMNKIEANIESLDISGELVSNLKLLVGVDLLRELEIFYLPQDDVPIFRRIKRRRPRKSDAPSTSAERPRRRDSGNLSRAGPSVAKRKRTDDGDSVAGSQKTNSIASVSDDEARRRRGTSSFAQLTPTANARTVIRIPATRRTPPSPTSRPSGSQPSKSKTIGFKSGRGTSIDEDDDGHGYMSESSTVEEDDGGAWAPAPPPQNRSPVSNHKSKQRNKRRRKGEDWSRKKRTKVD